MAVCEGTDGVKQLAALQSTEPSCSVRKDQPRFEKLRSRDVVFSSDFIRLYKMKEKKRKESDSQSLLFCSSLFYFFPFPFLKQ